MNESSDETGAGRGEKPKASQREIPGNFTYTTSHGVLKKILEMVRQAERPPTFSADFMESVLGFSGGSARAVPPILKRMKFLNSDGTPTDLYAQFQSDSEKSKAAFAGLKNAFDSIFKVNKYAHKLSEDKLKDAVVQISGLKKTDQVVRAIVGTFQAINSFVDSREEGDEKAAYETKVGAREGGANGVKQTYYNGLGLSYNINIVLPETSDINVFNAIFKSLRENILSE